MSLSDLADSLNSQCYSTHDPFVPEQCAIFICIKCLLLKHDYPSFMFVPIFLSVNVMILSGKGLSEKQVIQNVFLSEPSISPVSSSLQNMHIGGLAKC